MPPEFLHPLMYVFLLIFKYGTLIREDVPCVQGKKMWHIYYWIVRIVSIGD